MVKQQHMKPTRIRYQVLFLLFVNVVINYMDRSNLAVAATGISKEFQFTPVQMGLIFSAFSWTYLLFQVPGGILVKRFSPYDTDQPRDHEQALPADVELDLREHRH